MDEIKNNENILAAEPEEIIGEKEYVIFSNPDKKDKKRLGPYPYMPLSTSRILLSGLPGTGKRNLILNMVHKMKPIPSCVHIVHIDPLTTEYDQLANSGIQTFIYSPDDFPTMANIEVPEIDDEETIENEDKNSDDDDSAGKKGSPLVIVDEITSDQLGRIGTARFERLINYGCTHRDTTLICSIQSMMNLPAKVRRSFNQYALWRQNDEILNKIISQRCGIGLEFLELLFNVCKNKYEFVYVDLDEDRDSPMRYRLNWLYPISIHDVITTKEKGS
jgi:hypothetical protein